MSYPRLIEILIEQLVKLPGIGRRSAERIVFWTLNNSKGQVKELAESILRLKEGMMFCQQCNNLSESAMCRVCTDASRDQDILCVVEEPRDVLAIERTGIYRGRYHVLLGAISPQDGRGPEALKIEQIIRRVEAQNIKEVVIATDPDTAGETTALYITQELKKTGVRMTRIGLGIPVGSALEYADISTLSMSLTSRREI